MVIFGMLGPALHHLSLLESSLFRVFGSLIGTLPVAYVATLGPRSGNRTMVGSLRQEEYEPNQTTDDHLCESDGCGTSSAK